jgi:hypothetical protein
MAVIDPNATSRFLALGCHTSYDDSEEEDIPSAQSDEALEAAASTIRITGITAPTSSPTMRYCYNCC